MLLRLLRQNTFSHGAAIVECIDRQRQQFIAHGFGLGGKPALDNFWQRLVAPRLSQRPNRNRINLGRNLIVDQGSCGGAGSLAWPSKFEQKLCRLEFPASRFTRKFQSGFDALQCTLQLSSCPPPQRSLPKILGSPTRIEQTRLLQAGHCSCQIVSSPLES